MIITDKAQIKIAELRESNNLRLSGSDELECYELIESDLKLPADATFTRSSPAYLSDGTQVATNQPRFEQGKFGKAVMAEEGTENLLVKDLGTDGIGSIIDILVPNKVWAKRITVEANNYFNFGIISVPAQPNTKYTLTYWARLVSGSVNSNTMIYIGSDSQGKFGVALLHIYTELTSEWKKFVITGQTDANATTLIRAIFRVETNTGCTVEIADWQLEAKPYPTSFIDGTREAERLTIPTEGVLNPQEGTIEISIMKPKYLDYNTRVLWAEKESSRFGIHDNPSGGLVWAYNSIDTQLGAGQLLEGQWHYLAMSWNRDEGWAKCYVDGNHIGTIVFEPGTSPGFVGSELLGIGSRPAYADLYFNGFFDDLRISSIARSDEEILAAYQSGQPLPVDEWTTYKLDFDDKVRITTQGQIICNELIEI